MQRRLLLALLLFATTAILVAKGQQNATVTTAAARATCPAGHRKVSKAEADRYNKIIGWTSDQGDLAGVIVFGRAVYCECQAGWGSHQPDGAGKLPTAKPTCSYFIPRTANRPNCKCTKCPAGYTSRGGPLNSNNAACVRGGTASSPRPSPTPSNVRQTAYFKLSVRAAVNPCTAALQNKVAQAFAAGVQQQRKTVKNVKVTVRSCRATTAASGRRTLMQGTAPAQARNYEIQLQLNFVGGVNDRTTLIALSEKTPRQGICTLGSVCTAVPGVTVTAADGQTTPFATPSPQPSPSPSPKPTEADCAGPPTDETPNSSGFSATCRNKMIDDTCEAPCAKDATGEGYTATCVDTDFWEITGSCEAAKTSPSPSPSPSPKPSPSPSPQPVIRCTRGPNATATITNQTTGWPATCAGVNVSATCVAPCGARFTGVGYTATCTGAETWGTPTGSCTLRTCSGAPTATIPSNGTAWPTTCTNAPIGTKCSSNCTASASGLGYTAVCSDSGNWTVSGSCTLKTCSSAPNTAANANAWNSTACIGKAFGGTCTTACSDSATGNGYTATCVDSNIWNVTGSCVPKICATAPANTSALNSNGFPSATCANTTINGRCTATCAANATGAGYAAVCVNSNQWNITGNCTLRPCTSSPPSASNGGSWGASVGGGSCSNIAHGGSCRSNCSASATGSGYTATCSAGNWTVTGSCALKTCTTMPLPSLAPNSNGWPNNATAKQTCIGTTVGDSCRTACNANSQGVGYTALCNDTNSWVITGNCTIKGCQALPPTTNIALSVGWDAACADTPNLGNCTARCANNATGPGYFSRCDNAVWTAATGSCIPQTCFDKNPPLQSNQLNWICPTPNGTLPLLGTQCTAACAANSQGPGYTGVCVDGNWWPGMNATSNATATPPSIVYGTWNVTGSCTLRTCANYPDPVANAASFWSSSVMGTNVTANMTLYKYNCANLTSGAGCSMACAANSTGSGYMATCVNGNWTVVGACALRNCSASPPLVLNGTALSNRANLTWPSSCNISVGSRCEMPCASNATGEYVATCGADANWNVTGTCTLKTCPGLPDDLPLMTNWSSNCTNATHGTICSAPCVANATGGYSAVCTAGNWTESGNCTLRKCPGLPPVQKYALGWNTSCANATYGATCEATCWANATGGYEAVCGVNGWSVTNSTNATCTLRGCEGLPSDQPYMRLPWNSSCADAPHGFVCTAQCASNALDTGRYTATCSADKGWVVTGSCLLKRCALLPTPSPPLYSTGWNPACRNVTDGSSCFANCTTNNATGGYQAVCFQGQWELLTSESCKLKICSGLPPQVLLDLSDGWPTNCSDSVHGSMCNATCNANGTGLYQSRCFEGAWTQPLTNCTFRRCPVLPPQPPLAASNWSAAYRNATVGTIMELACAPRIAVGTNYSATCLANGTWDVTGRCELVKCSEPLPLWPESNLWPESCANVTHGSTCNTTCNVNATGMYRATCVEGQWVQNVTTNCTLKRCPVLPSRPLWTAGNWSTSFRNATVGTEMQLACSEFAFGSNYTAVCLQNGTSGAWNVTGSCEPIRCMGLPEIQAHAAAWNSSFNNSLIGTNMSVSCFAANTTGGSVRAICQDAGYGNGTGMWNITGSCELRTCPGLPTNTTPINSLPWNESCANLRHGEVCSSTCAYFATGAVRATCLNGTWRVDNTTSCRANMCTGLPNATTLNLSNGWNSSCANSTHNATCTATCVSNATGLFTAVCDGGSWNITPGSGCRLKTCPSLPTNTTPTDSSGWDQACVNAAHGSSCAANCTIDAIGGYRATCFEGVWTNSSTSCIRKRCEGLPNAVTPHASPLGWNASFANSTVGTVLTLPCEPSNAVGVGYNATCVALSFNSTFGNWSTSGSCAARTCPGAPDSMQAPYSLGWGNCTNTTAFDNCTATCNSTWATGPGWVATCNGGQYVYSGGCELKRCSTRPPTLSSTQAGLSNEWPASCDNVTYGTVCRANCSADVAYSQTGSELNTTCVGTDTWSTVQGNCLARACAALPAVQTNTELVPGWGTPWYTMQAGTRVPCNGNFVGNNCTSNCRVGTSGSMMARCEVIPNSNNRTQWVYYGECRPANCPALPALSPGSVGAWTDVSSGNACPTDAAENTVCRADCAANRVGPGYTITCFNGFWGFKGNCSVTTCSGVPSTLDPGAAPWNATQCSGLPLGAECQTTCNSATHTGSQTAKCVPLRPEDPESPGDWTVTGNCTAKFCAGDPISVAGDQWRDGWINCTGKTVYETCTAQCKPNSSGTVVAMCTDTNTWNSTGVCTPYCTAASLPRDNATLSYIPNSEGWNANCDGTLGGARCSAKCTFSSDYYYILCDNGQWQTDDAGFVIQGGSNISSLSRSFTCPNATSGTD